MSAEFNKEQPLERPCQFIKGVGPRRAEDLSRLGIETVEDLLLHFPRSYLDLGAPEPLNRLQAGQRATVRGRVMASGERQPRRGMRILSVLLEDGHGRITLTFFNQPYLKKIIRNGVEVIAAGEVSLFRSALQMVSPEFEILESEPDSRSMLERPLLPVYPLTRGVGQRWLRKLLERVLAMPEFTGELREILPQEWLTEMDWPGRIDAIRQLHFPADRGSLERARTRLKFDELFLLQLLGALRRKRRQEEHGIRLTGGDRLLEPFLAALPFELTDSQRKVLKRIREDLISGGRMNRLLQGDVGSGKTVVALAALIIAVEGNMQSAFMVPLEVLARQHNQKWAIPLESLGVRTALLTGGTPAREKRRILAELKSGEIDLLFGTQALIQEGVDFARLGLAVVDEQHRFGVMQRAHLLSQGMPHMLVMSATPIPRSLAMTLYGDLDLSIIDELPPGRPALVTRLSSESKLPEIYSFIRDRLLKEDERAFLIFPLVEEGDKLELKSAKEEFEELKSGVFADIPCDLVHGRMSPAAKSEALERFRSGESRLLMATTVIEVGIDIPEATLMVIHNPERFGLSQLHQLRGRIGRGTRKSYCMLAPPEMLGESAGERLTSFVRHKDGFKLAEEDLKQRGPGEIFGARQHGRPELSLAHPLLDAELVELARIRARALTDDDPELVAVDLRPLRSLLLRAYKDRLVLSGVG
ncbi:MAG: ATP-dependent DNA helicase RecG [bacterium]|nr:ATP-dependent DNA helicase RecG [bacterium]